jgi:hypothetical protein
VKYDADLLAEALVQRLRPHLPPDFTLVDEIGGVSAGVEGTNLWIHQAVESILNQQGDPSKFLKSAALAVLNDVQDLVTEHQGNPWPRRERGPEPIPYPGVAIRGEVLYLWYGNEEQPSLELDPIPLKDLEAAEPGP